jgi:hypothetical protein
MNTLTKYLVESILTEGITKNIVVYAGRFQPFHKGHYAAYSELARKFGKDNVYIATSNKTDNVKSPFGFTEKKYIMTKMFGIPSNKIVQIKNPYAPVEILGKYDKDTTSFISAIGEKDNARLGGKYFEKYKEGGNLEGYMNKGYVYTIPPTPNPISGTDVRNWLGNGTDAEKKKNFMKAYPKFDEKAYKLITLTLSKNLKEDIIPGGLSNGKTLNDIAKKYEVNLDDVKKEIKKGIKVEKEHTSDLRIAAEIAKDHLWEDLHYYEKLATIENKLVEFTGGTNYPNDGNTTTGYIWNADWDDYDNQDYYLNGLDGWDYYENDPSEKIKKILKGATLPINNHKDENGEYYGSANKLISPEEFFGLSEMAKSDMDQVEKYADSQLSPEDIDLGKETDHFFQRLNDPRNGKEISAPELTGFFKRLAKHKKQFIEFLKKYKEFVVLDKRTNINIPFMKVANKLIAKTIMRKPDFKSSTPIFVSEGPVKGIYGGTIKIGGVPVKIEVDLIGADNRTKEFVTKVVHIDSKYFNKLPIGSEFRIPARIFRTPGGGWYKVKHNVFNESVVGNKIICDKCGWKWKIEDGGNDVYTCHKCGEDNKPTRNEGLLMEGGAYGHMNHPFDIQMNLTFGDLKRIVKQALSGKLELAREKTDGQALAVSWINGRLVAARNKSHLKNKGKDAMSVQDVISKFAGRGSVSDAFSFAIKDLESAIKGLPEASKKKIFKDGKCFMNCEIIYPANTNVIPYGQSLLVFHGTMEYDEGGNAIGQTAEAGTQLAAMVKKVNADVQSKFTIQGPPVQKLPVNKDLKAKQGMFLSKIQTLQSEFGLTDKSGVADYHQAWWMNFINKNTSGLDEQQKIGLVKRWAFGEKGFRIKDIKDQKNRDWAEKIEKQDQQKITKDNLLKFETIFLGVGAEVLSFMTSVLTVNPDAAKQQMVGRLETAISSIRATGDAKNLDKLNIELARIEALGGFDKIVPNEGIVFNYKGNTFKLTGAFAPLNQILGIFTFSR